MFRTKLLLLPTALFITAIAASPVFSNPSSIPISQAFDGTQKLQLPPDLNLYLDFSDTDYRVIGAYPSNPQVIRALKSAQADGSHLKLVWVPSATAKKASMEVKLAKTGEKPKSIIFLLQRTNKDLDNLKIAFTPFQQNSDSPVENIRSASEQQPQADKRVDLIRPNWKKVENPESLPIPERPNLPPTQESTASKSPDPKSSTPIQIKPLSRNSKVQRLVKATRIDQQTSSYTSRKLISRDGLSKTQISGYLRKGLSLALGLRHISNTHPNYLKAQDMIWLLNNDVPIERALKQSGLPLKSYNDFLGYGGVVPE